MKPGTRRLGRGLGAFLDFGPSGEGDDAPGYAPQTVDAETKSILETSVGEAEPVRPAVKPSPVAPKAPPPPPPAPRPAPVATAVPAPPPPAPRVQIEPVQAPRAETPEPVFVDEVFEGLSFPDVELE